MPVLVGVLCLIASALGDRFYAGDLSRKLFAREFGAALRLGRDRGARAWGH